MSDEAEISEAFEAYRNDLWDKFKCEPKEDEPEDIFEAGFAAGRDSRTPRLPGPPDKPGFYLYRLDAKSRWKFAEVYDFDFPLPEHSPCRVWQWAGPIPEPEEPR